MVVSHQSFPAAVSGNRGVIPSLGFHNQDSSLLETRQVPQQAMLASCGKPLDPCQDKANDNSLSSNGNVVLSNVNVASSNRNMVSSDQNFVAELRQAQTISSTSQQNESVYPPGFEPRHNNVAIVESLNDYAQNNTGTFGVGKSFTDKQYQSHPCDSHTQPHISYPHDPHLHISHPHDPHISHLCDQQTHQHMSYSHGHISHPYQQTSHSQVLPPPPPHLQENDPNLYPYQHSHELQHLYQKSHDPHSHELPRSYQQLHDSHLQSYQQLQIQSYQQPHDPHQHKHPRCLNKRNPHSQSMSQTSYQGVSYPHHPQLFPQMKCPDNSSMYASTMFPSGVGACGSNFQTYDAGGTVIGVPVMNLNAHSYLANPSGSQSNQPPQLPMPLQPQAPAQVQPQPQPQPRSQPQLQLLPQPLAMSQGPRNYNSREPQDWRNATLRKGGVSQNIRNTFKFTKYAQGNHLHQSNPDKELLSSKRYHQNYLRNKQEHLEPLTEFSRYSTCHSSSVVEAHFPVPPEIQDGKILCMRECKASNLESSQCTPLNEHVESDASYSCSTFGGKNQTTLVNAPQALITNVQAENCHGHQVLGDKPDCKQRHCAQYGDGFKSITYINSYLKINKNDAMQGFAEASDKIKTEEIIAEHEEATEATISSTDQSRVCQNTKSEKEVQQLYRKHTNYSLLSCPRSVYKAIGEPNNASVDGRLCESLQIIQKTDSKQTGFFTNDDTRQVTRLQQSSKDNEYINKGSVFIKCNGSQKDKSEGIEKRQIDTIHNEDLPSKAPYAKQYGALSRLRKIEVKERDITGSRHNGFSRKQKDSTRNDSENSCSIVNTEPHFVTHAVGHQEEKENRASKRIRSKATESKILSTTHNGILSMTCNEVVSDISERERSSGITLEAESSDDVNTEFIHNGARCNLINVNGNIEAKVNRTTQSGGGSHIATDGFEKACDIIVAKAIDTTPNSRDNAHNTVSQKSLDEVSSGFFKVKGSDSVVLTCCKHHKHYVECSSTKAKKNLSLQCVSNAVKESSYLLQCCRFIVNNSFLQKKPPAVLKHFQWLGAKGTLTLGDLSGQITTVEDPSGETKFRTLTDSTEIPKREEICVAQSSKEPDPAKDHESNDVEQRNWEAGNSSVSNNKDPFDIDELTEDASLASVLLLHDFSNNGDHDMILEQTSCKNGSQPNDVSGPGFGSENQSFTGRVAEVTMSNDAQNQTILEWLACSGQSSIPLKLHSQQTEPFHLQNHSDGDKLSSFMHPYFIMDSSGTEGEQDTQACSWRRYYNDIGEYQSSHDVMCKNRGGLREAATFNELISDAKYASMMSNIYSSEGRNTGTLFIDDIDNEDMTNLGDDEDVISQYINFDLHGTDSGICFD